jgi:murein DD-endopeptidase MepM/ murein hydrolase activator NlpD
MRRAKKRAAWTVIIAGEDTESPRTLRVSRRALQMGGVIGSVVLTGIIGTALVLGGIVTTARHGIGARPTAQLLHDSLVSLDRQAAALRVVAGLQDTVSADSGRVATGSIESLLHRADQLSVSLEQVTEKLHSDADRVARTPSIMPTAGWLTSQFTLSRFHPILHKWLPHLGIDVAAPYGTTVVAPAAGTVIRAGEASGYGMVMEIDHGDGIVTKYGHLSRFLVHDGQKVVRGQPIAEVGNSGLATGPHLHYEVHVGGTIVDPLTYVLPETIPERVKTVVGPGD